MPETKPKLSGFEFLERLGRGAFGEVWLARDLTLQTLRAVKIVAPDRFREQDVRRLIAEAQALARLPNHRNRVVVHQIKDGITNCFLVMDHLAGGSLERLTAPGQPMPWPRAVRYVAGVGDGLVEVHQHGLLHRDVKPSNILLDPDRDEAVLGDFGLAVALGSAGAAGTRAYMAPEVLRGVAPGPLADVYALAGSLLHLVTGRPPDPRGAAETDADASAPPAGAAAPTAAFWPADVPEAVREAIAAGMAADPNRRADLPRFLGLLREARWRHLAEVVLHMQPRESPRVRLEASVAVAPADSPQAFTAVPSSGSPRLRTGDLVRVESVADADGHQTVLLLGSSGSLEVALPRPTGEGNFFAAGQRHRLVLRLSPPGGRERVLVVWSRVDVRRSPLEWQEWLERRGVPAPARPALRGVELVGSAPGPAPQGDWRALVVALEHASPGPAQGEVTVH